METLKSDPLTVCFIFVCFEAVTGIHNGGKLVPLLTEAGALAGPAA